MTSPDSEYAAIAMFPEEDDEEPVSRIKDPDDGEEEEDR